MKKILLIIILTLGVIGCKDEAPEPQPECNCGILIRRRIITINNDDTTWLGNPPRMIIIKYSNRPPIVRHEIDVKDDCTGDTITITVKSHYGLTLKQPYCWRR